MSLFSEKIHQDDKKETDHFENIQSTNWQTMRFKVFFPSLISEFGIGISWTDFFFFLLTATTTEFTYWLACGIPPLRASVYGL